MPKTTPKKEGKAKYDWAALKVEYFESEFIESKAFFLHKYGKFTSGMQHNSTGWPREKRLQKIEEAQLLLQNLKADRVKSLSDTLETIISIGQREIERMRIAGRVNVKSWVKIWEVIRTEAGLPKSISRNLNENTEINLAEARESLLEKANKAVPKK